MAGLKPAIQIGLLVLVLFISPNLGDDSAVSLIEKRIAGKNKTFTLKVQLIEVQLGENEQEVDDEDEQISSEADDEIFEHVEHIFYERNTFEEMERNIKRQLAEDKADSKRLVEGLKKDIDRVATDMEIFRQQMMSELDEFKSDLVRHIDGRYVSGIASLTQHIVDTNKATLISLSQELNEVSDMLSLQFKNMNDNIGQQVQSNSEKLRLIEKKTMHIEEKYVRGNVRIVNVTETFNTIGGRLEVFQSDRWGTVCDRNFGLNDAHVACRSMGFSGAAGFEGNAYFGLGQNDIWKEDVACSGIESSLFACGRRGRNNCDHSGDVGVVCNKVRLASIVEMDDLIGGRIELFDSGRWGTICDENFDMRDARVACLSMGYSGVSDVKSGGHFGQGEGNILMRNLSCTGEEHSLFSCERQNGEDGHDVHSCTHLDDAGVICNRTSVRLANITDTYGAIGGRLEVFYSGQWRTICEAGFDMNDARVACISLGFPNTLDFKTSSYFGQGDSDGWIEGVSCSGGERSLFACDLAGTMRAGSGACETVGVVCDKTVVRLANVTQTHGTIGGRLEVFHSGIWGTVCDSNFDLQDAEVACRNLGFSGVLSFEGHAYFGPGSGTVWISDMNCTGEESTLLDCERNGANRGGLVNCGHVNDVGVVCNKMKTRLVNTTETFDTIGGRLEVFYSGQWGTVCDRHFDMIDANVVCRSLGYIKELKIKPNAYFGEGENEIWMEEINCTGTESSLFSCNRIGAGIIGPLDCEHSNDIGLICDKSTVRLQNIVENDKSVGGRLEVYYAGSWGTICDDNFDINDAKVACSSLGYSGALDFRPEAYYGSGSSNIWLDDLACTGTETSLFACARNVSVGTHNCNHGEDVGVVCDKENIRLANSTEADGTVGGRLDVFYAGNWNSVCEIGFGNNEATVACRSFGFSYATAVLTDGDFGHGNHNKWMYDIRCKGDENNLFACERVISGKNRTTKCDNSYGIGLLCTSVRLANIVETDTSISGRLEVYYSGEWGSVCDDYFDINDANVACYSMGFGKALDFKDKAHFGSSTGRTLMDDLKCVGNETSLFSCPRIGAGEGGSENCEKSEDVGVICSKTTPDIVNVTDTIVDGE